MKKTVIKIVKWIVLLGVIGVIGGSILPFAGWELFGKSDYENFLVIVEDIEEYVWAGIMIGAIVVSIITGVAIDTSMKLGTSIWMIIAALGGEIGFRYYVSIIKEDYYGNRFGVGKVVMEGAYIVLIAVAFISLGVSIYYNYFSMHVKNNIVPMGYFSCPKCGKTISKESKFCEVCGFSLDVLVCPSCGARREMNAQFCKECGKRLPIIDVKRSEDDSLMQRSEQKMSASERRLRDRLLVTLTLMTLFAILTILIGIFLPYAKSFDFVNGEWETVHRMIHGFNLEAYEELKLYLMVMGIGVIISHVALVCFGKFDNICFSIMMVVSAVVGRFSLGKYKKEVFTIMHSDYKIVENAIGVSILEIAYVVLFVAAVIALVIDIFDIKVSKR